MMCSATGERPAKCFSFTFHEGVSCTHAQAQFAVYINMLLAVPPLPQQLKLLVVPTINLVISHLLLYFSLSPIHTYKNAFLLAGFKGEIKMPFCIELWQCRMSEDGNVWWAAERFQYGDSREQKLLTLTFTGNGTFKPPLRRFAWRKWHCCN